MYDNIDEIIEINLNLLGNSNDRFVMKFEFVDMNGNVLGDEDRFAEYLVQKGLIRIEPSSRQRCDLTDTGYGIFKSGGWIAHLNRVAESKAQQQIKLDQREQLETELAKSNIEANKLNAKIAEQNRIDRGLNKIFLIINAFFAVINIAIAILQLIKPVK